MNLQEEIKKVDLIALLEKYATFNVWLWGLKTIQSLSE